MDAAFPLKPLTTNKTAWQPTDENFKMPHLLYATNLTDNVTKYITYQSQTHNFLILHVSVYMDMFKGITLNIKELLKSSNLSQICSERTFTPKTVYFRNATAYICKCTPY